jgi:sugar phosphate isomerase/epimerase
VKISFLLYDPVPNLAALAQTMERVAELGYHGIELVATHPLTFPLDELIALSAKYRLPVVSLLSGWSYGNEKLCLSSPASGVRERAVRRLEDYVGHAARLGAIVVVGLMQGLQSDEPDEAAAKDRIASCLRQVAAIAADHGVTLVIEPVNHLQVGFNHTAAEAAALMERVGSPAFSYMLDTIHMNIEEHSMFDTIRVHGSRIRHFHLCETNGGPFGTGNLDFPKVLATLEASGYDRYVSVKIYRKLGWEEAAQSAAAFLRQCGVEMR